MSTMSIDASAARDRSGLLADAALRAGLTRFIRGRVPSAEVDDIVQATLTEALASQHAPEEAQQLQRWVYGIARHKCADFYRHQGREAPAPEPLDGDIPVEDEPHGARDLLRWAERELPEGENAESTLEWMLREAGGDKLETIADEAQIPAPRVRQRVARMRKHYRARWAAQVAAIVAAVLLVAAGVVVWRHLQPEQPLADEIKPEELPPNDRAGELRRQAFQACEESKWHLCLERLDEAARLDPAGDAERRASEARRLAGDALKREKEDSQPTPVPLEDDGAKGDEPKDVQKEQPKPSPKPFRGKNSRDGSFEVKPLPTSKPSPKSAKGAPELTLQQAPKSDPLDAQQTVNVVRDGKLLEPQQVSQELAAEKKSVVSRAQAKGSTKIEPSPLWNPPVDAHQRSDVGPFENVGK